jgi:hypothetical protein
MGFAAFCALADVLVVCEDYVLGGLERVDESFY